MEKKLPGVFVNKIGKKLDNNKTVYYGSKEERKVEKQDQSIKPSQNKEGLTLNIRQKINRIFQSVNYVYKMDVVVTTRDQKMVKRVVGYNDHDLITFDNELIPISDIIDIEVAKEE